MNPHTCLLKIASSSLNVLRKCALLAFSILLANAFAAHGNNLRDGLVAYWPLDADNGGTTPDVAFTNTMNVIGGPAVGAGQRDNAFTFVEPTTYLTNGHSADNTETGLPIYRAGSYTIMMWVKGAAQTVSYLYSEGGLTSNNPLLILQTGQAAANSNKFDVIIRSDAGAVPVNHRVSTTVVFDDIWHHIAWVDDRGNAKLYVDGVLDATDFTYAPGGTFTMETSAIGTLVRGVAGISTAAIFNGQIDDVALWERALSQDEVNFVMTNGIPTPVVPLAPGLYEEPASAVKNTGDWHRFSAFAAGSRPYATTYQWNKNGSPISGENGQTLFLSANEIAALNPGDSFSVTVTNDIGSMTSSNATLTLIPDPAPAVTNGLVNYWPLDVFDANTNSPELHFGHSMQMVNMNTNLDIVPGQFSNSVFFFASPAPGTYGYRTSGSPIYSRTNYTVSLWVNSSLLQNDRRVFSEGRDGGNNNPLFTLGTDNTGLTASATAFVRSDTGVASAMTGRTSTRPVFDGNWHHLVWTDAKGKAKLYVDGVLDETDYTYTRPPNITLNITYIGATARTTAANVPAPVTPYTGIIDEVATWDRVLTWTEIQLIMTNGVPIPTEVVLPPVITVQPPQRTNNVFVGDDVTFPVQVDGTPPFDFQWRKDGTPISGAVNPSALTDTLSLANVQLADSNTTYSVVVANPAGSVTSIVAQLYVNIFAPITNGEVLNMDVGLTASPNPQPGFSEFTLGNNPASFDNGVRVTLSGIGTALAERNRVPGQAMVVNNPPAMTQAQIYNDFVFANSTADFTGMSILIERLATNTAYGLTFWSFDPVSAGLRFSDWTETSSGTPVVITNGYTFDGNIQPTQDYGQTFGGLLTSSATGTLQLEGIKNGGTSFGVFVNAIRLVANPTATRIAGVQLAGANLRLTVEGEYPGQPIFIHQTSNLNAGPWTDSGATPTETRGPVAIFEIPVGPGETYYRAVSYLP